MNIFRLLGTKPSNPEAHGWLVLQSWMLTMTSGLVPSRIHPYTSPENEIIPCLQAPVLQHLRPY